MKTFGQFAKERLRAIGRSQKALAETLEVSPAYISQIFTGKKKPPDLGRQRNRAQLKIWSEFLRSNEEDLLDMIRFQLHRVPLRPAARHVRMRALLLSTLVDGEQSLADEIRALEMHPAENRAIFALVKIYLVHRERDDGDRCVTPDTFKDMCNRARTSVGFVDGELVEFYQERPFSWVWDPEMNDVHLFSDSSEIHAAITKLSVLVGGSSAVELRRTVPVVGHVSAGEGFEFTDGGYPVGEGFERAALPPGVDPVLAGRLYCVRVRGQSLKEFINEGALLFIKPESWEEIRDGDLVIFKDRIENKAFVKKVEFSGGSLILKSMNPMYKNIVLVKNELSLLERVMSIVL